MKNYSNLIEKSKLFFSDYGLGNEIAEVKETDPEIIIEKKLREAFRDFFEVRVARLDLLEEFLDGMYGGEGV